MPEHSLRALGLVDAPPEAPYDNLTELATRMLGTPVALVSIVEPGRDRQFFKSQVGVAEPWASRRQTPLSHSFCRHVVEADAPLVVDDARGHAVLGTNAAIEALGVVAYLGAPVRVPCGEAVGALCVIDGRPRRWREVDVGNLERLASSVSDTIRLRAALNASETLRAEQRDFTYALSHDLRSPIGSVRALLVELSGEYATALDASGGALLEAGLRTIDRSATLIEDVLRYTRSIEREFEPEAVPLDGVAAAVADDLAAEIAGAGATLDIGPLPVVLGEAGQLRMLVHDLVANAVKFRRRGTPPRVRVAGARDGRCAELVVSDDGIGIAPEDHERIFGLFARLHVDEAYPGSGLGLTVVRRVASNHGGTVVLSSAPGAGATFTVRLPAA